MSIYSKGLLGAIIGGAVTGAVARFIVAGKWTWPEALRHVGYGMVSAAVAVLLFELYAPMASLTPVALFSLGVVIAPAVARTLYIIATGAFSAKFGGFEINSGKENENENDK